VSLDVSPASLRLRKGPLTCPCCHDELLEDDLGSGRVFTCADCDVSVHADCVELAQGCPTLGCSGQLAAPPETVSRRLRHYVDQLGNLAGVLVLSLLVGATLLAVFVFMAMKFLESLL
jgi:hypothetical protein